MTEMKLYSTEELDKVGNEHWSSTHQTITETLESKDLLTLGAAYEALGYLKMRLCWSSEDFEDFKEAHNYYNKAIECGFISARMQLDLYKFYSTERYMKSAIWEGYLNKHFNTYTAKKSLGRAIEISRKLADEGNPEAFYDLGECYETGLQDDSGAFNFYLKSANLGVSRAQAKVANYYFEGIGVEQSDERTRYWLSECENSRYGFDVQQKSKSLLLVQEALQVFPSSISKAKEILAKAKEELGWLKTARLEPTLNYCLGAVALAEGNNKEAVKLINLSAQAGDAKAQYTLGEFYLEGEIMELNYNSAESWLTKSAEQGDEIAQFTLGLLYKSGDRLTHNPSKAKHWFSQVANNKDSLIGKEATKQLIDI